MNYFRVILFACCMAKISMASPNVPVSIANNKKALSQLIRKASGGNAKAQYLLGTYYMTKNSKNNNNYNKTTNWLQKALENDYAPAGYSLGLVLLKQGPEQRDKATEILLTSAQLGDCYSQYLLGILDEKHFIWQQHAEKQGINWAAYIKHESHILHMNEVFLEKE